MTIQKTYEVIIIGGSYAGLSAAMALGRALKQVLIIDSANPCNKQTPHSHNFITQDGETPAIISKKAKEQVLNYKTVTFIGDKAMKASKTDLGFNIETELGNIFNAKKILFASGVKDIMPEIEGFKECWGISAIHCPYCHGYEVKHETTGILLNSDMAFEVAKLISNWTNDLTIFTNGTSTISKEFSEKLISKNIKINEKEIVQFEHTNGYLSNIVFADNTKHSLKAMYTRPLFKQHCDIAEQLGCELTEMGHLKIDQFQKTTVSDLFAAGDCTTPMRTVSKAVSDGTMAGVVISKEIIEEQF